MLTSTAWGGSHVRCCLTHLSERAQNGLGLRALSRSDPLPAKKGAKDAVQQEADTKEEQAEPKAASAEKKIPQRRTFG